MNQKKIRFLKKLSTGLVVAAMVFAFLIAGIRIFGVQVYGVLTGSMEPAYPTGSLIYVKDVEPDDLRVNDVITFSISPGVIATHRIVEIVPDEQYPNILRYRTKGDANKDVDASLVSANNIIGKAMFAFPQLGYVANYIQQSPGIYLAILVCGLMIAFVFYTDSLDEKQKKQEQQFAEEKPGFDLTTAINQLSRKLLGKELIKHKEPPEPVVHQGYVPQQPTMQPPYQQIYPQQGMYPQYPQQNYPTQMPQQPAYGTMQPYVQQGYQQYPIRGYQQQPCYPQPGQTYQQPAPQPYPYQMTYSQQNYAQTSAQSAPQNGQNPPFVQQWNDASSQADQHMNRTY